MLYYIVFYCNLQLDKLVTLHSKLMNRIKVFYIDLLNAHGYKSIIVFMTKK